MKHLKRKGALRYDIGVAEHNEVEFFECGSQDLFFLGIFNRRESARSVTFFCLKFKGYFPEIEGNYAKFN